MDHLDIILELTTGAIYAKSDFHIQSPLIYKPVKRNHYSHGQVFGTRVPHLWVLAVEPIKYLLEELKRKIMSVNYKYLLTCISTTIVSFTFQFLIFPLAIHE